MKSEWVEHGPLFEDAGDHGGDVQVGKAYSRRFRHTSLPGRLYTVTAYPIQAEGLISTGYRDPLDPSRIVKDDPPIRLEWQSELMVCRSTDDPGGTEVWSDYGYPDLPERFDGTYPSVLAAEVDARQLVRSMEPHHIGWDGSPEIVLNLEKES